MELDCTLIVHRPTKNALPRGVPAAEKGLIFDTLRLGRTMHNRKVENLYIFCARDDQK